MTFRYQLIVRILPIILLFSQSLTALSSPSWGTIAAHIATFGPRSESSAGETALVEYIGDRAAALALELESMEFSSFRNAHSFSRVLSVRVPGAHQDELWIAVPIDQPAEMGSAGTGSDVFGNLGITAAVALMERYAETTPALSLRFLFLGSEHGRLASGGSRLLLSEHLPGTPSAVFYLRLTQPQLPITIEAGARGTPAPLWLVEGVADALSGGGVSWEIPTALLQLQRIGLGEKGSLIEPYLQSGIPAVILSDNETRYSNVATLERFGSRFERAMHTFLETHSDGLPTAWDRNYLIFRTQNGYLPLREAYHVGAIFGVLSLTLLYGAVARKRTRRYRNTIARNILHIPGLIFVCFIFLFLATLVVRQILTVRAFPELWSYYPVAFFLLKILGAVFLFAFSLQLFLHRPFSKNGSFYSAAALLLLFASVVVTAVLDVVLSYYFIWAFLCAFLFSISRRRRFMLCFMLAAPAPLLVFTYEALSLPELQVAETLLLSPVRGNLLQTLIVLPFLLMFVRMDFLLPHPSPGKRRWTIKMLTTVSGTAAAALLFLVLSMSPFSYDKPRPVHVDSFVDHASGLGTIELRTPDRVGELSLVLNGAHLDIATLELGYSLLTEELAASPLQVGATTERFLDRERVQLQIESTAEIAALQVVLHSDSPLFLLHSTYPTRISEDRLSGEIFVGARPPLPLSIEFTVPAGAELELELLGEIPSSPATSYALTPGNRLIHRDRFRDIMGIATLTVSGPGR